MSREIPKKMTTSFRNLLANIMSYESDKRNNPDEKIYRIFEKRHFFEMFEKKENTLILPHMWEDPFENLILQALIENTRDDGTKEWGIFGPSLRYGNYAQCWGAHEVPDAMWHIYSNKKNAVQVETTIGKLIRSLQDARTAYDEDVDQTCRILKVNYMHETELKEYIRMTDCNPEQLIDLSLTIKRSAFKHEHEVRLFLISNNRSPRNNIYKYLIEPHTLIDQVIIDPEMCPCKYTRFKKEIIERTELDAGKIRQSTLCQEPEIKVRV